ncbi:alcohol dehydrogenase [Pyricularia oryzae 70-15]|uniref:Alcohol dehydrogenase n=1 Tax=Pyricularia oryzae (strain 70-15 / ATCC MYA-4617 / FGSC 8958) TaxID=242507 RepID=G4MPK8_PYRO7|nr:alcohol dehydrogenase [Pyricularia oryzae 70-15]EHA56357.1 alcohol dehydrogenase [Pyricularia oryzae 70-15]KAI7910724.1 alcohol dehydrogenase [Pyricularia oryzae]
MSSKLHSDLAHHPKSPKTMRAVIFVGLGEVETRDVPFPEIEEPEDVILRITTSAVCGSDLHNYRGYFGPPKFPYPIGHEAVGVVYKVGPAVDSFKVGDRVITAIPDDRPITTKNAFTSPGLDLLLGGEFGTQAEYMRIPFADSSLIPIPNRISDKEWIMVSDAFATAWQGLDWAGFQPGDSVAVFGAGPVGLMAAYSASLRGASRIYIVDHNQQRLDKALEIGSAVIPINFLTEKASDQILKTSPGGVNRAIDCVGQEGVNQKLKIEWDYVLRECIRVTTTGGGIGLVGAYVKFAKSEGVPNADEVPAELSVPVAELFAKQLSVKAGTMDPTRTARQMVSLVENGRAKPSFVIDEGPFDLDQAPQLYRRFNEGKIIKVLFRGAPRPEEWEQCGEKGAPEGHVNGHNV